MTARLVAPPHIAALLFWVVAFAALAIQLGPDATWDLRNYHIYSPFAVLTGRLDFDIAPARFETYFSPVADLPTFLLRTWLNDRPALLNAVLSLPTGIGAFLATLIARRFVPAHWPARWPASVLLAAFGATGAAGFSAVGTSQSEMLPGCFVLGGFYVLLRHLDPDEPAGPERRSAAPWPPLLLAGVLFGVASGLKLTELPYNVGATAAVVLVWTGPVRRKLAASAGFGSAILAGMAATGGWWWLHLWHTYGSPLFPLYNEVFRSPFAPPSHAAYSRYKPAGLVQALVYPWFWSFGWGHPTSEAMMRDPRFLVGWVAFWAASALRAVGRLGGAGPQVSLLLVFCGVSFAVWEALFSTFRYLAPLEMLLGIIVFLPLRALMQWRHGPPAAAAVAAVIVGSTAYLTFYPRWGRASPRTSAVMVVLPALRSDGLMLLLDSSPMAYLVPSMPPSVRVLGTSNFVIQPGQRSLLQDRVEQVIAAQTGPIYGLDSPQDMPGEADRTLAYYGLRRDDATCAPVPSNLDHGSIRLCTLLRTPPARP